MLADSTARVRPPLYVFLTANVTLIAQDVCAVAATASATGGGGGSSAADAAPGCGLGPAVEAAAVPSIPISFPTTIAGPPDGRTILNLGGLTSVFRIINLVADDRMSQGTVLLANLTLSGLPAGPPGDLPRSLLRLGLWAFAGVPLWLGGRPDVLVARDVAIELPPEEVALWFSQARVVLPAALAPYLCVGDAIPPGSPLITVTPMDLVAVQAPDTPNALHLVLGQGKSSSFVLRRVLLRPAWGSAAAGSSAEQADATAASVDVDAAAAVVAGFGPYTSRGSICTIVPPMWGEAARLVYDWRALYLLPYDLGNPNDPYSYPPQRTAASSNAAFKPVMLKGDLALLVSSSAVPDPGFGQVQAAVTFPVMLMGEPVWRRVLDLAALPSAAVVAGPRGLLTLRHLTLVNAPMAGRARLAGDGLGQSE
ncbi:hypothetical protein GPECTOR_83g282 [Gonium pectorale]|uniref:Uncharacterized protein n=1 Tax=Gonium pectorale TaxID=33097 RepID=A0A150G2Y0_GONPE|nr:hypothetical protein GPECTOR_83g282 [Gonium pectorale]|eukprot:KXZ43670.1 hypothetical protein GPECTOR_83g282 [Gonium pectorale]